MEIRQMNVVYTCNNNIVGNEELAGEKNMLINIKE